MKTITSNIVFFVWSPILKFDRSSGTKTSPWNRFRQMRGDAFETSDCSLPTLQLGNLPAWQPGRSAAWQPNRLAAWHPGPGSLAAWQCQPGSLANLSAWQPGNLPAWQLGSLAACSLFGGGLGSWPFSDKTIQRGSLLVALRGLMFRENFKENSQTLGLY